MTFNLLAIQRKRLDKCAQSGAGRRKRCRQKWSNGAAGQAVRMGLLDRFDFEGTRCELVHVTQKDGAQPTSNKFSIVGGIVTIVVGTKQLVDRAVSYVELASHQYIMNKRVMTHFREWLLGSSVSNPEIKLKPKK